MKKQEYWLPDTPRLWFQAEFARFLRVNAHSVNRWLKAGLLPKRPRGRVRFGGRDLNRLNLYAWFQELNKTALGRKRVREMPKDFGCPRLFRFPHWITHTGNKRHPVLRAWERSHGGGLWTVVHRMSKEAESRGDADAFLRWCFPTGKAPEGYSWNELKAIVQKWGPDQKFLFRYLATLWTNSVFPKWPETKEEGHRLLKHIQRTFTWSETGAPFPYSFHKLTTLEGVCSTITCREFTTMFRAYYCVRNWTGGPFPPIPPPFPKA